MTEVYNMNPSAIYAGLKAEIAAEVNQLMPKAGGSFTGNVVAAYTATAGDVLRNVAVRDASNNLVSTMGLSMVRK